MRQSTGKFTAREKSTASHLLSVAVVVFALLTSCPVGAPAGQDAKERARSELPKTLKASLVLPQQDGIIDQEAVSPDGSLLATVVTHLRRSMAKRVLGLITLSNMNDQFRSDSVIKIWDAKTGELKRAIRDVSVGYFVMMRFSPNGRTLLTSDDSWPRQVKLWDVQTGTLIFAGPGYPLAFSTDGKTLAVTDMPARKQCRAGLIDVATGKVTATLTNGTKPFRQWDDMCSLRAYFSNDNQRLITASSDRDSELWDTRTGQRLAVLSGNDSPMHSYWDGATEMFSPDGKIAVTVKRDLTPDAVIRTVKVWDAATGALLRSLANVAEPLRFSPDGKVLAAAATVGAGPDASISLWDVATGKSIKVFSEPKAGAGDIAWSPDGRTIAAFCGGKLKIWDVENARLKATLPMVVEWEWNFVGTVGNWDQLFFRPDSRFLIVANRKSSRLIDVKTGAVRETIDKLRRGSFTPDGYWVTRTQDKKSVAVWEIQPS